MLYLLLTPHLVAPDEKSENLSLSYLVAPDEKSEKLSQQKVPLISLDSACPYCGLGRGVVGSEGFPSPHSLVGSDGFVPMSIIPIVLYDSRTRILAFKLNPCIFDPHKHMRLYYESMGKEDKIGTEA